MNAIAEVANGESQRKDFLINFNKQNWRVSVYRVDDGTPVRVDVRALKSTPLEREGKTQWQRPQVNPQQILRRPC